VGHTAVLDEVVGTDVGLAEKFSLLSQRTFGIRQRDRFDCGGWLGRVGSNNLRGALVRRRDYLVRELAPASMPDLDAEVQGPVLANGRRACLTT
jgi:hypothetical protein